MTLGDVVIQRAREAKAAGKLGWDELRDIVNNCYRLHQAAHRQPYHPLTKDGPTDPCFDALARAQGSEPESMPAPEKKKVAVALIRLREIAPDVTPDEIRRRGNVHRSTKRWECTAWSIVSHWSRLNGFHETIATKPKPEGERVGNAGFFKEDGRIEL